jgi:hypothetical protein
MGGKLQLIIVLVTVLGVIAIFGYGHITSGSHPAQDNARPESIVANVDEGRSVASRPLEETEVSVSVPEQTAAATPLLSEKPTRKELEEYARQRRLAKAESEGRLEEYLAKEEQMASEKEAKRLAREKRREESNRRHELRAEYRRQVREARENGEEPPPPPPELRKLTKEEKILAKEQRKLERMERNEQRNLSRMERL